MIKGIIKKNRQKKSIFYLLLIIATGLIVDGGYIFAKAQLAQYLISDAWEETLAGKTRVKPWPWADTWPVAKLKVQNKSISFYVLNGANGASLPFGPGHMTGSALPGGSGSSIIAGHRDTHFEFLQNIDLDEKIQIQTNEGHIVWYKVNTIYIADSRKQTLDTTQDSDNLILVTCYPFDAINPGGPLRYVVTAKKIST